MGTQRRSLGASRNGGRRNKKRGGELELGARAEPGHGTRRELAWVVWCCVGNYGQMWARGSCRGWLGGLRGFRSTDQPRRLARVGLVTAGANLACPRPCCRPTRPGVLHHTDS